MSEGKEEAEAAGTHFCVPVAFFVVISGDLRLTLRLWEVLRVQMDGWGGDSK